MAHQPSYEELVTKLAELQEIIRALRDQEVDAVVGTKNILMLRLRETEEELRRQRNYLDNLVNELADANKELESFSYSVSHDLRAPLRAIEGYSRMILLKHADNFDGDARSKFNVIMDNTRMMGQLIEDLLAFSRLGKASLRMVILDMEDLIENVWKEVVNTCPDRRLALKTSRIPPCMGDRGLIRQLLTNLLANAVKFTKTRAEALIEVGGDVKGNDCLYYIRDNGIGFDMKFHDKIFDVFHRLHRADEFEGTGVGLALVKRIVNRHNGKVWAEGEVDNGATFYFTLPTGKE